MLSILVTLGFLVAGLDASGHLVYEDCNNSPNKILHFENAVLSADPLHFPGDETGSIDVQIKRNITGRHHELKVFLQKKATIFWLTVPCISQVGSCTYQLCDLLSGQDYDNAHHCPIQIATSTPDFPCACPFQAGNYHLNPTTFFIDVPGGIFSVLASGDYKVKATITDTDTHEEVGCYTASISTETDCTGLSCLIDDPRNHCGKRLSNFSFSHNDFRPTRTKQVKYCYDSNCLLQPLSNWDGPKCVVW